MLEGLRVPVRPRPRCITGLGRKSAKRGAADGFPGAVKAVGWVDSALCSSPRGKRSARAGGWSRGGGGGPTRASVGGAWASWQISSAASNQ
ncbi:hypothetical protein ACU4GD_17325 [Cupriavidus basilensis]